MQLNTDKPTQRVNPAELRKARALYTATLRDCKRMALQAVVTAGLACFNEDWSQEAKVIELEEEAKEARAALKPVKSFTLYA